MRNYFDLKKSAALRRALLTFYAAAKRDLPWRRSRDPYAVWVAEIMLQQTQADTVVSRYVAFLQCFPTLNALATTTSEAVCEAWAGLGYYRRARNLHRAAQIIYSAYDGQLPQTVAGLMALPGIGRYTAGAIASIAFELPAPIVDGNVARILSRLFKLEEAASSPAGKKRLWQIAEALVQGEHPGAFNQAMMELGATVCTPRAPRCVTCPVTSFCHAYRDGVVQAFPPVVARAKPKALAVAFAYVTEGHGVWLVRRSVESGLWAGLWELPSAHGVDAPAQLVRQLGCPLGPALGQVNHTLTHRQVTATVFTLPGPLEQTKLRAGPHMRCWRDPLQAPLSALARKAILAVQQRAPNIGSASQRLSVCF